MHAFALPERELAVALEALPPPLDAEGAHARDGVRSAPLARGPARTGALMLLRGVLEQRAAALAATGSAEDDAAALAARPPPPPRLTAALIYRAAQKRIAAGYLRAVRDMLARETTT